jgi:endoglucanase
MPFCFGLIAVAASLGVSPVQAQATPSPIEKANQALGRGMNMGNMLEAPSEGEWGVRLDHSYFKIIKDAGFQSVRIPIKWSTRTAPTAPYTIDPAFMKRVDQAIDAALRQKLRVVVNIHHYDEMNTHPERELPRLKAMWEQIGSRLRRRPATVYFEMINEPHGAFSSAKWNEYLPQVLAIIRKTNPTRPVIVGGANWNNWAALRELKLPSDPNLIATFHFYDPFQFTHQGAEWVAGAEKWADIRWTGSAEDLRPIQSALDQVAAWSKANRRPVYVGEFGAYSKADKASRVIWTRTMVREFEARGFSWAYWEFASGFGAWDPGEKAWRRDILSGLLQK